MNGNRPIRRYKRRSGGSTTAVIIVLLVVVALALTLLILALLGKLDPLVDKLFGDSPNTEQTDPVESGDPVDSGSTGETTDPVDSGTVTTGKNETDPPETNEPIDTTKWLALTTNDVKEGALVRVDNDHLYQFPLEPPTGNLYAYRVNNKLGGKFSLRNTELELNTEACAALAEMLVAFNEETGKVITVWGAYRSYGDQEALYSPSSPKACKPGGSDYHTGNAALLRYDHNGEFRGIDTNAAYADWFKENAHKYGFIMRYPKDKEAYTGTITDGESHYRYVGVAHATLMHERDLCLEEYTELVRSFTLSAEQQLIANVDGVRYRVYSVAVNANGVTKAPIPQGEYTMSGDNIDQVIFCEKLD